MALLWRRRASALVATLLVAPLAPSADGAEAPSCAAAAGLVELKVPESRFVGAEDAALVVSVRNAHGNDAGRACPVGPLRIEATIPAPDPDARTVTVQVPELARYWTGAIALGVLGAGEHEVRLLVTSGPIEVARVTTALVAGYAPDLVVASASVGDGALLLDVKNVGDWPAVAPGETATTRVRIDATLTSAGGGGRPATLRHEAAIAPMAAGAAGRIEVDVPGEHAGRWALWLSARHRDGPMDRAANDRSTWELDLGGPDARAALERFETRRGDGSAAPCDPACPPGAAVRAVVRASVTGGSAAPNVSLTIDGAPWATGAPGPGGLVTSPWRDVSPGRHAVLARVDPDDALAETDEANNELHAWLDLPDPDAPRLHAFAATPPSVREGGSVAVAAEVSDAGPVAAVRVAWPGAPAVDLARASGDGPATRWTGTLRPRGVAGSVPLDVEMTDSAGHTARAPGGTITVEPWPVEVRVLAQEVNDEPGNRSTWRGSYRAAANEAWAHIELAGHGHANVPLVHAWLDAPDGRRLGPLTFQAQTGPSTPGPGPREDESLRATASGGDGEAVEGRLATQGGALVDTPGAWSFIVHVQDVAGRTHEAHIPFVVDDPDGAPRVESPLRHVAVPVGDASRLDARATDALRVERVWARFEHAAGTTSAPLRLLDPDDGTASGAYRLAGRAGDATLPWAGRYDVTLVARDVAGNVAEAAAGAITVVDGTPPRARLAPMPGVVEHGATLTVSGRATAATRLADAALTVMAPGRAPERRALMLPADGAFAATVTADTLGAWQLELDARDGAGASARAAVAFLVVPDAPPALADVEGAARGADGWWVPRGARLGLVWDDPGGVASMEAAVAGAKEALAKAQGHDARRAILHVDLPDLVDDGATVRLHAYATDRSGATATEPLTLTVDATPPGIAWSVEPALSSAAGTVAGPGSVLTVRATDDASGVQRVTVGAYDGADHVVVPLSGTESAALDARARDAVGNEARLPLALVWDDVPPLVAPRPPPPGETAAHLAAEVDDASGVAWVVAEWATGRRHGRVALEPGDDAWRGTLPPDVVGRVTVAIGAADVVGNEAWSAPFDVRPEDQPPSVVATTRWDDGRVVVTWTASDPDTAPETVRAAVLVGLADGTWVAPDGATDLPSSGVMRLDPAAFGGRIHAARVLVTDGMTYGADAVDIATQPGAPATPRPPLSAVLAALTVAGAVLLVGPVAGRRR